MTAVLPDIGDDLPRGAGGPNALPQLVFALARAQGTDLEPIRVALESALILAGFVVDTLSLQEELWKIVHQQDYYTETARRAEREWQAVLLGDRARLHFGTDAMARLGREVISARESALLERARSHGAVALATILSHVVHPDEVHFLRREYGAGFFLISVFEHRESRKKRLSQRYTFKNRSGDAAAELAEEILRVNEGAAPSCDDVADEDQARFRLDLKATFPLADLFLSVEDVPTKATQDGEVVTTTTHKLEGRSEAKLAQLVLQIVGYPFSTPDIHEMGMAYAYLARVSSASLGRQVGAAILSGDGDLIATGWNEVPSPRGGVYRQHYSALPLKTLGFTQTDEEMTDYRDHRLTGKDGSPPPGDSNSRIRFDILVDLLKRLDSLGVLNRESLDDLGSAFTDEKPERTWAAGLLSTTAIKRATFSAMLEYGRSVHAEMNAITTAARRGLNIQDATMYVTTFPCHECARHVIASGIKRVIYIEPFPKSRVFELHGDAVTEKRQARRSGKHAQRKIEFGSFIGISPWRHEELFSMVHRKKVDQADGPPTTARDLWDLATWQVNGGRLRPAFRPHVDGGGVGERISEELARVLRNIPDSGDAASAANGLT